MLLFLDTGKGMKTKYHGNEIIIELRESFQDVLLNPVKQLLESTNILDSRNAGKVSGLYF